MSTCHSQDRPSLGTVRAYIEEVSRNSLESYEREFTKTIGLLKRVKGFGPGSAILEIGSGTGWFTVLARKHGYDSVGVDVSWELVEFAKRRAAEAGVEAVFHEASADSLPLPDQAFDVAYANSVMEHVEKWQEALAEAYRVLKPEGLLFVGTTNRLYPVSTEMDFPLYQWLPLGLQKRIAIRKRGPEIMVNGFAWNHFTPMGLRRALHDKGFRTVIDVFDLVRSDDLRGVKRAASPLLPLLKRFPVTRIPFFCLISTSNLWAIK